MKMPDVAEKLIAQGSIPTTNAPAQFDALIKSDVERYGAALRAAGVGPS